MTDQTFSSLLAETVQAPRLSGSKVKTLTDQFISALDTGYITTFFKLNRSLPAGGQARISSLYVFDALSRGAHKDANKGKRKADAKRCLDGLEAVSESWVEGMTIAEGGTPWSEGKEKARKIIEIWKKTETFPVDTTERLAQRLGLNTPVAGPSTTPPYEPGMPPPISPALPPLDPKGPNPESLPPSSNGEGPSVRSPSQSSALPPDILKLLGLPAQTDPSSRSQNGSGSSSSQPPPPVNNPGSAELAAILARLPTNTNSKPQSPSTAAGGAPSGAAALAANPLAGLNMGQLAELAKVAQSIKSPPVAQHPTLPPFPAAPQPPQGYTPPQHQQQYQQQQQQRGPYPPQGHDHGQGHGYGYGNDRGTEREEAMPPGTSRNYGRVKPLRNSAVGIREPDGRTGHGPGPGPGAGAGVGAVQMDDGYQRGPAGGYHGRPDRDDGDRRGSNHGWDRQRERSRSPDRGGRDGGWASRGRGGAAGGGRGGGGGYGHQGGRGDDFGRDRDRDEPRQRPPIPSRPDAPPGPSGPGPAGPTLETFDMTTFNPMDPGSWATLGEAWKRSRGSEPNQMELMGWMQEKMMGAGAGPGAGQAMGMSMGMGPGMGIGMQGGQGGGGAGRGGWGQGGGGGGGWQGQGGY